MSKTIMAKSFFFEFNKMAKEKGAGWVDYWWPKPGESSPSRKISYVKLCKANGESFVVGSGVYDLPDDQVDKLITSQETPKELAKETESAIVKTNVVKATSDMVIQKVNQACELLEKEGKAAFPKFKGKKSEFIFAGTYIWINDLKGVMIMHPVMAQLEGKDQIGWQDSHGKLIFVEFNKVAKEKGSGWVDYWWPKPGESKPSHKISFVKLCKIDGEDMVVGCGIYDLWDSEIAKLVKISCSWADRCHNSPGPEACPARFLRPVSQPRPFRKPATPTLCFSAASLPSRYRSGI